MPRRKQCFERCVGVAVALGVIVGEGELAGLLACDGATPLARCAVGNVNFFAAVADFDILDRSELRGGLSSRTIGHAIIKFVN